jgi:ABC-2 type transport system permease protein
MSPVVDGDVHRSRVLLPDDTNPVLGQTDSEGSLRRLVLHTWVQTQRLLIRWCHDIQTLIQALILPPMFLVSINLVFGKPVSSVSGHSALYGSVPMAALVGAIFGSTASGICLMREREEGLLARFWVLPVNRASGLLARLVAEAARILVTTVLVICTGMMLGFRYQQGIPAVLAWVMVPVVFGVAFSFLVITAALYLVNTVLVEATGVIVMLLIYFCTGFVPLAQYPNWIQPMVHHQPMSYAVDAMRGFSLGGPVLAPTIGTLLWSVGIVVVSAAPMVIGYRKASTR